MGSSTRDWPTSAARPESTQRAVGEREIDAAALLAGDDRRLADGGVKRADGQLDLRRVLPLREHVAPAGKAAFDEPRVDRGPRAADEDVVAAGGKLHLGVGVGEGPLHELHGPRGNDRGAVGGLMPADGVGGAFHFGQTAAVGADGDDFLVADLQQHAAEGVAAAFVVGGEERAADQLAEAGGRKAREFFFGELRRPRGTRRGFRRRGGTRCARRGQACFADRLRACSLASRVLAEDLTHLVDREDGGAGGFDFDAGDLNADADFEVGGQERGRLRG